MARRKKKLSENFERKKFRGLQFFHDEKILLNVHISRTHKNTIRHGTMDTHTRGGGDDDGEE